MTDAAKVKLRRVITTGDLNLIRFGIVDNSYISFQTNPTADMLIKTDPNIVGIPLNPPMTRRSGLLYKTEVAPNICYKLVEYFKNNF